MLFVGICVVLILLIISNILDIHFISAALIVVLPYNVISFLMEPKKVDTRLIVEEKLRSLLENDSTFKECNFNDIDLSALERTTIANALKENTNLKTLELGWNQLFKEGCKELANALKVNKSLTRLMIGFNAVGNEGCEALATVLKHDNTTLTDLNLAFNDIQSAGVSAIAQTLLCNKSLLRLDLSSNLIGTEGIQTLAEAMAVNQTLTSLNLKCTGMTCDSCKLLAPALEKNHSVTHLILESNGIRNTGAIALANALVKKKNTTLYDLNLSDNEIGIDGYQAFLQVLENNNNVTLQTLDLRFNHCIERDSINKFTLIEKIRFYLKLNKSGRNNMLRLLDENTEEEDQLIAEALAKTSPSTQNMDLFFSFLLSRPELCNRSFG